MVKKISAFALGILFIICAAFSVSAEGELSEEAVIDSSQPRLMVTSYELEGDSVTPGKKSHCKVVIKNQSGTKSVRNLKLSLSEDSGDIRPDGMGTQFVNAIYAGSTYTWEFDLTAVDTAQIGEHIVTVMMEYEDKNYASYSASDVLRMTVKQSVSLDYDGAALPVKVYQEDNVTVDITLMNTGKTNLRNCKIDYAVEHLTTGGTTFVGEIPAGESKTGSTNLRVDATALGEAKGKVTISYEDAFGETYTVSADLSTVIEKKVIPAAPEEEEKQSKYPLWWVFLLVGLVTGGGIGCAIPIAVYSKKQRKEDELRL